MSLPWKLVSAPRFVDADADGIAEKRVVLRGGGSGYDETLQATLGPTAPEIVAWDSGLVAKAGLRGASRSFRIRPDGLSLRVPLDAVSGSDLQTLYRMMALGRPVAFTPWWDPTTAWMSGFTGVEEDGFLAEIGYNAATMHTLRSDGDYYPAQGDGWLRLATGPKLVPGMVGNAILLERDTANLMTSDTYGTIQVSSSPAATAEATGEPNGGPTTMIAAYLPDTGWVRALASAPILTAPEDYVLSFWVKGEGTVRADANCDSSGHHYGSDVTLSPDAWQRVYVAFTTSGADATAFPTLEAHGSEVHCVFGAIMLEAKTGAANKSRPSSFQAVSATPTGESDKLFIDDTIPAGGGFTIALWIYRDSPSDRGQIFSGRDNSVNYYAYISANQMFHNLLGGASNDRTVNIPAPSGTWEQVVLVVRKGVSATGMEQALYHNGILLDSDHSPAGSENHPDFSDGWYLGGAFSPISTGIFGLNFPLDAFRVDLRPWTADNVMDDYAMRREAGIAALLSQTQGRYFRIADAPKRFKAGIFTDSLEGDLVLQQVSTVPAGIL